MATKKARGAKPLQKELTAVELEMMNVIWRIGPCSVAQVQEQLRPQRELAYTSVSTIVRILEQKGYVTSEKAGRGHVYAAAVSKERYQALSLKRLVRNVFDGAPSLLVERLLASEALAPEELAQIRSLLREKGKG
jgi:predicted transcriptional regulator